MTLISALLILLIGAAFGVLTTGLVSAKNCDEKFREGWQRGYAIGFSAGIEKADREGEKSNEPNQ
jgi:hypothetical protein